MFNCITGMQKNNSGWMNRVADFCFYFVLFFLITNFTDESCHTLNYEVYYEVIFRK